MFTIEQILLPAAILSGLAAFGLWYVNEHGWLRSLGAGLLMGCANYVCWWVIANAGK